MSRDRVTLERVALEDATPDAQLSPKELRKKKDRERKRKQRAVEQKEKAARFTESEAEWWQGNRATLKPEELAAMKEQDAYIRDLLFSMETVVNVQESDPELIDIIVDFVKEHGVAHLGRITKGNIPLDWSSQRCWQQPELVAALENENEPTKVFVRSGLLIALPDWRVERFLVDKAKWTWQKAADLLGYHIDHTDRVSYR